MILFFDKKLSTCHQLAAAPQIELATLHLADTHALQVVDGGRCIGRNDLDRLDAVREQLPLLKHRRLDVYRVERVEP